MTTINDLKPRLSKLLPMLGSDNPNEAANAARMITGILKSSKLDWHELVKKLFEESQKSGSQYYSYQQNNSYERQQNSYSQHSQSRKNSNSHNDDFEYGDNWYWQKKETGNYSGEIFGRNCTVFKSKKTPGLWDAVINEFGGNKIWLHGYKTAKAAKEFIQFKLDPDAKDDW